MSNVSIFEVNERENSAKNYQDRILPNYRCNMSTKPVSSETCKGKCLRPVVLEDANSDDKCVDTPEVRLFFFFRIIEPVYLLISMIATVQFLRVHHKQKITKI